MSGDGQFKCFGRAVIMRLLALNSGYIDFNEWDEEEIEKYGAIVSQCASALVSHTFTHFWRGADVEAGHYPDEEMIPDLDELPIEQ